jgi:choline dehydrogenase
MVDLVRPVYNTGEVTLNSADPLMRPNINLNFLSDELDIIALCEGTRFSYDVLTKGDGSKDLVVDQYPWDMPLHSDELMKMSIQNRVQTSFHLCGTNRPSKDIDQGSCELQTGAKKGTGNDHTTKIEAINSHRRPPRRRSAQPPCS